MTTNVYVKRAILVTTVRTLMSLITVSLNLAKMEPTAAISWKIISVIVHKVLMYVCYVAFMIMHLFLEML